ncbi:SulP family inorganic anion transporter [Luteolibacter sp. LG18]|uniref:SulP family inorganic anion transporter n=1 Tax=Luteolibacter sp. LG18 TaxID=2819286 RepID=UPI002B2BD425|nr:sulfate permease [Luteolibacter sp. LG18]
MKWQRTLARRLRDIGGFFSAGRVQAFPFTASLGRYDLPKARQDARAALNVTMLAIPQAMAFASIAQLPIIFGVLCAIVAPLVAPLFAGSRHTSLGPTNATAFMLFSLFAGSPALMSRESELVPLLVLMSGLLLIAGALLKVADLLQYISRSVLVGYSSGAAVLIIVTQLKEALGIGAAMGADSTRTFASLVAAIIRALPHSHWPTLAISASTIGVYLALQKFRPRWPNFAISLVLSSAVFGSLIRFGPEVWHAVPHFKTFTLEDLSPKMPGFGGKNLFDDISMLVGVAFAIAFLSALENTLMAKTIASRSGDHPDLNQDMLSVGMANLASAFAGGMPASGSLTRSALNFASGARTRFASTFAGIYILAAAILIALSPRIGVPLVDFLPKAALSALVIALALALFNPRHIRICLRSTPDDAAVLIVTFVATLLMPLHVAIFVGVALSITLFLRKASKPYLVEYEFDDAGELRERGEKRPRPIPAISIVHVEGDLFFGAAELFRTQIQRTVTDPTLKIIILRLKNARHLDATSVMALEDLIRFTRAHERHIIVSGATREVYRVLKQSGILATLQEGADRKAGESNLFIHSAQNPNVSTRNALKRAQELLGGEKADIRIFYDPSKK